MRTTILGMLGVIAVAAGPASAAVVVTAKKGTTANYAAPTSATTVITFNNSNGTSVEANAKGYQVTYQGEARRFDPSWGNSYTDNGTTYGVATPAENDGSAFFFAGGGGSVTFMGTQALSSISLFIGSLDSTNTITLLNQVGNAIASFNGSNLYSYLSSSDQQAYTGDIFTSFSGTSGTSFYGISLANPNGGTGSFEFDNLAFTSTAPVPELGTWAMMLCGFGMIGATIRRTRRKGETAVLGQS